MRRAALLTVGLIAVLSSAGCYRRVVRVNGVGASGYDVQPVYRSESAVDRLYDRAAGSPSGSGSSSGGLTPR